MQDSLDNPSEPPPFQYWANSLSPAASTGVPSDFGFGSGCATPLTPMSMMSGSHATSGCETPMLTGHIGQICTMVPAMWLAVGDRCQIPSGIVQQARAIFECHKDLSSQLL